MVVVTMPSEDWEIRLDRLIKKLRKSKVPVRRSEANLTMSVSAGVSDVKSGDEAENVIRKADESLYEAKKQGKGRVVRYTGRAA